MNADVQYNDLIGTVAADLSGLIGGPHGGNLSRYATYYNIDINRFKVVGIELSGPSPFYTSLICVDKHKSNDEKEFIVNMSINVPEDNEENNCITGTLFERIRIVLYEKFDNHYPNLPIDQECNYEDFH